MKTIRYIQIILSLLILNGCASMTNASTRIKPGQHYITLQDTYTDNDHGLYVVGHSPYIHHPSDFPKGTALEIKEVKITSSQTIGAYIILKVIITDGVNTGRVLTIYPINKDRDGFLSLDPNLFQRVSDAKDTKKSATILNPA